MQLRIKNEKVTLTNKQSTANMDKPGPYTGCHVCSVRINRADKIKRANKSAITRNYHHVMKQSHAAANDDAAAGAGRT
jgi:hypothetical protein